MLVMEEVEVVPSMDHPNHEEDEPRTEVHRELRDLPPTHYLFKIQNFSLLSDAKIHKYESCDFEVSGYKWKLCVYPKKNEESKGGRAYRSIFVFGCSRCQGEDKPFSWDESFEQVVPLDVFNDASNGYLIDDCCIFGAEVFVLERISKGECVSILKKLDISTFTWSIKNYRNLKEEFCKSPAFVIGGFKWTLLLYPNGNKNQKGKSLSMYLCLEDPKALNPGERLNVRFFLRVKDMITGREKDHERLGNKQYSSPSSCNHGFRGFMPLSYLKESSQGYVNSDNVMVVELQIVMLTLVKDFS
ncbi:TRAF-like family protein [Euphorbia peplus]|nr:TRAF-like family protein [Euphorbia peplus]